MCSDCDRRGNTAVTDFLLPVTESLLPQNRSNDSALLILPLVDTKMNKKLLGVTEVTDFLQNVEPRMCIAFFNVFYRYIRVFTDASLYPKKGVTSVTGTIWGEKCR